MFDIVRKSEIENRVEEKFVPIAEPIVNARAAGPLQLGVPKDLLTQIRLEQANVRVSSVYEQTSSGHEAQQSELLPMPIDCRVAENFLGKVVDSAGIQIYLPERSGGDIGGFDASPGELQKSIRVCFSQSDHLMGKEFACAKAFCDEGLG